MNWSALHGDDALDVLHASNGAVIGVGDTALLAAHRRLHRHGVPASPSGAAGLAGLPAKPDLAPGLHVVLVTGHDERATP